MVNRTTKFVPNYPLYYPYAAVNEMFKLVGVKSAKQFGNHFASDTGITNEDMEKIIFAGLMYDQSSSRPKRTEVKFEDVSEKFIPIFYDEGYGYDDLINVMMMGLIDGKVIDGTNWLAFRRKQELLRGDRIVELLMNRKLTDDEKDELIRLVKTQIIGIPEEALDNGPNSEGDDQGEDKGDPN